MSTLRIAADADELAESVAVALTERIAELQRDRTPTLVLTGGTVAKVVYERLGPGPADWSNVDYYWGDERWVPAGDADRNDKEAHEAFLDRLGVPAHRIHAMPAERPSLSPEAAAEAYEADLPSTSFDLVLLGMGPDAHIASLFPGHRELDVTDRRVVPVHDSPKPPPTRLTLTYPALNNTDATWLIVSGAAKSAAVLAATSGDPSAPAAGVKGATETIWWLDEAAAAEVQGVDQ